MRLAKIVILMSEEALPTVLIEALVCDRIVISTDCDFGPRELLLGGRLGILLPPYNNRWIRIHHLADIIEDMLHCRPDRESDLFGSADKKVRFQVCI